MENVVFWLIVIGTAIWTIQWIFNASRSLGHKKMIIPILLLWAMIIYFYKNPETSRYHMLLVSPLILVAEMIISMFFARLIRRK